MSSPSVVPYFVLMLLYVAIAHLIIRYNGFYARITSAAAASRYESLDGLRGFLALGVFFHHAVMTRTAYVTGKWSPPDGLYGLLGPYSVRFFFIITGFLFWSKAIHSRGRIRAMKFWINRILRIGPMCLVSVIIVLVVAAAESNFQLREPAGKLLLEVLPCFSLGVLLPNVNGIDLGRINAQVFWTLRYEWCFYAVFPLLAWFAMPKRFAWLCLIIVPLTLLAARLDSQFSSGLVAQFLLGMIAAHLVAADVLGKKLRTAAWSLAAIAVCAGMTAAYNTLITQFTLLFAIFLAIAYDSTLFMFLRWPSTKLLGTISYSVYLLHGMVLFVAFRAVNRFVPVEALTEFGFWSLTCCCGILVVILSSVSYRFVEHPFLGIKSLPNAKGQPKADSQMPFGAT